MGKKSTVVAVLVAPHDQAITKIKVIGDLLTDLITAYIGIGSNLKQPIKQVRQAVDALENIPSSQLLTVSRFYRSPPMGPSDQPDYINAAACLKTQLSAPHLLDAMQSIEEKQGRIRDGRKWRARTLDLDLLLYGEKHINSARLTVPHRGIGERIFVLQPLFDLNPVLMIPGKGSVQSLLKQFGQGSSSNLLPIDQKILGMS